MMRQHENDLGVHHAELISYWGPLLHLLVFGLGWRRPDLGLERWHNLGQPADDPILAVVKRWWGRYVPDVLAWTTNSPYFASAGEYLSSSPLAPGHDRVDSKWLTASRSDTRWQRVFGSGDAMHLSSHAITPVFETPESVTHLSIGPDESARAVLICETYSGWYRALSDCGLAQTRHGSSWRVDVVVKPLGWLGSYRISRRTGVWFSGQHRWHQLGWSRSM